MYYLRLLSLLLVLFLSSPSLSVFLSLLLHAFFLPLSSVLFAVFFSSFRYILVSSSSFTSLSLFLSSSSSPLLSFLLPVPPLLFSLSSLLFLVLSSSHFLPPYFFPIFCILSPLPFFLLRLPFHPPPFPSPLPPPSHQTPFSTAPISHFPFPQAPVGPSSCLGNLDPALILLMGKGEEGEGGGEEKGDEVAFFFAIMMTSPRGIAMDCGR